MKTSILRKLALGLLCWIVPLVSQAWWHDDWAFRKQLSIDTSPAAGDIAGSVNETQVLVRLHTGNFAYFLDVKPNGEDIRFVDGDDLTPLKFHIERFDPINQMALIWVRLPGVQGGATPRQIWMYYGNAEAVAGGDAAGSYDTPQALVLHFADPQALGQDATAYGNHAQIAAAGITEGAIGAAAGFDGSGGMTVPAGRGLLATPESGFTLTAWAKIDAEQSEALLLGWTGETGNIALQLAGATPRVRITDAAGAVQEVLAATPLALGQWHHLAVVGGSDGVTLYVNGNADATLPVAALSLNGALDIGAAADATLGLIGQLDEVGVAATARSADWIRFAARAQAADARILVYGEDGQNEASGGGHSAFATILRNVTVDGWVVIVMLVVMGVISWVVMFSKGAVISRIRHDNLAFLAQFSKLGTTHVDKLDSDDLDSDSDSSPLLTALSGRHKHFESSNIYRLYHAGVQEMHHRTPKTVGAQAAELMLTPQAIGAIKATMDGALTRELQKLNSQMVLLTIAISGGPFLGLLGTVVGVMIVFAEIAAVGDVNVNAIAPGIAAALVATAAGVGVAIPALFGYNYLGSRIKEISADMHVFVDEFVAKIAEQHS
jgi:biopolymer transport protein ExbB